MKRLMLARDVRARVRSLGRASDRRARDPKAVSLVGGAVLARMGRVVLGDRSARAVELALPVALEATARGLRAGASLRQSIADAAAVAPEPLRTELGAVASDAERGATLVDALERWGSARDVPGVRLAVAALALVAETGGAPARTLDAVAATLRERSAIEREVRALATQARASAGVVAAAPLGFVVLMATVDSTTAGFLLGTPAGLLCLAGGLALDGAGGLWMRRITRSVR